MSSRFNKCSLQTIRTSTKSQSIIGIIFLNEKEPFKLVEFKEPVIL